MLPARATWCSAATSSLAETPPAASAAPALELLASRQFTAWLVEQRLRPCCTDRCGWPRGAPSAQEAGTGASSTVRVCPLERLVTRQSARCPRLHGCRRPGGPSTPSWVLLGDRARSCWPWLWARLAAQGGWGKQPSHPRSPGIPCAAQGPCRWLSPHSQAALPSDQLGRTRRQLAAARELDGLVQR